MIFLRDLPREPFDKLQLPERMKTEWCQRVGEEHLPNQNRMN
jgi:hypothetical protein